MGEGRLCEKKTRRFVKVTRSSRGLGWDAQETPTLALLWYVEVLYLSAPRL